MRQVSWIDETTTAAASARQPPSADQICMIGWLKLKYCECIRSEIERKIVVSHSSANKKNSAKCKEITEDCHRSSYLLHINSGLSLIDRTVDTANQNASLPRIPQTALMRSDGCGLDSVVNRLFLIDGILVFPATA